LSSFSYVRPFRLANSMYHWVLKVKEKKKRRVVVRCHLSTAKKKEEVSPLTHKKTQSKN
jgi:hypothetical protein